MKTERSAEELFDLLNEMDECDFLEAKGHEDSNRSVMETVCSFSNEPHLGGGYILLGIGESENDSPNRYIVEGISNPDKAQLDFSTQCASMFNQPIRPEISVEKIQGKIVLKIRIEELGKQQKPLYFLKDGLPRGAYRRIGSSDHRCTDDDLQFFYQSDNTYDQSPVKGARIEDVDAKALERYRILRSRVNPSAEELLYSDFELLQSLGCINPDCANELNLAGTLLFGSSKLQRRVIPSCRIDYIRISGSTWIEHVDDSFDTIDMRGPLLLVLYRIIDAINSDLPKGFLLEEQSLQAKNVGLPLRALREAIVNALIHRSYRTNRPTQIIRYDNRIEIINAGFSLKEEKDLGKPGSITRNPYIAAVFHETNLAETKGTGIRRMKEVMKNAHMTPPTFESNRNTDIFTTRLLLHHFLNEKDIEWLAKYSCFPLNDSQKSALIFTREVGAIDNSTYRQMGDCDTLKASADLKQLTELNLLIKKGKSVSTYYVLQDYPLIHQGEPLIHQGEPLIHQGEPLIHQGDKVKDGLPDYLQKKLELIGRRAKDSDVLKELIVLLCEYRPMTREKLAQYLKRSENHVKQILRQLILERKIRYLYPEMPKHPQQAYVAENSTCITSIP